jgi:hypothetical protein
MSMQQADYEKSGSFWFLLNPNCPACEAIRKWRESVPNIYIPERDKIYLYRLARGDAIKDHKHIATDSPVSPSWKVDKRKRGNYQSA